MVIVDGCLVAQNTVAEIWSDALQSYFPSYNV